jgi:hypothetical protein
MMTIGEDDDIIGRMGASVREILAQIDQLDDAGQEELRAALRARSRDEWRKLAEPERRRSASEGLQEDAVQRAVDEIRYGPKSP